MATAKEICMDSAGAASSELDGIYAFKEEERTALQAFLSYKEVFDLFTTFFGKSFAKHSSELQLATGHRGASSTWLTWQYEIWSGPLRMWWIEGSSNHLASFVFLMSLLFRSIFYGFFT